MIRFRIPLVYRLKSGKEKSLKISTNKIYAGVHWGVRQSIKEKMLKNTEEVCGSLAPIQSYPVIIEYHFVFYSRALDSLNTAFMAKMIEDALRELGVLLDDDVRYVSGSVLFVEKRTKDKKSKDQKDFVDIIIKENKSYERARAGTAAAEV